MRAWVGLSVAAASSVVISTLALLAPPAGAAQGSVAQAGVAPSPLYVDLGDPACSDQGPGTTGSPYCTIQEAADAAVSGQTIEIGDNLASGPTTPATITTSGITLTNWPGRNNGVELAAKTSAPIITLNGVHDVTISSLSLEAWGTDDAIDVTNSTNVTLERLHILSPWIASAATDPAGIRVTNSQDVTVTTNAIAAGGGPGVQLDNTTNSAVASNSVYAACEASTGASDAVGLRNGSSATVENNVLQVDGTGCAVYGADLAADASSTGSAGGVTAGYNAVYAPPGHPDYTWNGTSYDSVTSFQATGQGVNDIALPSAPAWDGIPLDGAPVIDSADCSAPGLLSTDFYGNPRVADPNATDAALARGTCHADRGPFERQDALTMGSVQVTPASLNPTAGQAVTVGLSASSATSGWGEPVTYTADFGDGSAPAAIPADGTTQYAYTATGKHTITVTAADTGGTTAVATRQVTVYTAQAPTLTVQSSLSSVPLADTAYFTVSAGADAWEIASATINFGDGTSESLYPGTLSFNGSNGHVYPKPGTYTATVTTTDDLGRVSTATTTVTVGDLILPSAPARVWSGTLKAHQTARLGSNQLGEPGSLVTVTVTSPQRAGSVIVYNNSTPRPNQAAVQFSAGQPASNIALATDMPGGVADFYNNSNGSIGLTVTMVAEEATTTAGGSAEADTYVPVTPATVLPATRVAGNNHDVAFTVTGAHGVPATAGEVVLDVTASGTSAAGRYFTYPDPAKFVGNWQQPGAYWAKGQAVTGLATVETATAKAFLRNASSGAATFTVRVVGYYEFEAAAGAEFFPSSRTRVLDVTIAGKHGIRLPVAGKNGVPVGADAVMVNLTATGASTAGSITAYADGTSRPVSLVSLSYAKGETIANAAIVAAGSDGAIDLYNNGTSPVTIAVDLTGSYYAGGR